MNWVAFPDSLFTITAIGETSGRRVQQHGSTFTYWIVHSWATIEIEGVGSFEFINPTRTLTYVNQHSGAVGFSLAGPSGQQGIDLVNGPRLPVFSSWEMHSAIGSTEGTGQVLQWFTHPVYTTGGILTLNDGPTPIVFTATIPAPFAPVTLGTAVLLMAGRRRRRSLGGV